MHLYEAKIFANKILLFENNLSDNIKLELGTLKDALFVYNSMSLNDKHLISPDLASLSPNFVIIAKDNNTPIGFIIGIEIIDNIITVLLGINSNYRGYKLGIKLTKALIDKSKKDGYTKILWWCKQNNIASESLIKKFGGELINQKEIEEDPNAYKRFILELK